VLPADKEKAVIELQSRGLAWAAGYKSTGHRLSNSATFTGTARASTEPGRRADASQMAAATGIGLEVTEPR
jgi:hypothetical protein